MRRAKSVTVLAALFILVPGVARADGASVLLLAGLFQLCIGNLFIGVGEGALMVWRYGTGRRSALTMVAANYASAWLGWYALSVLLPGPFEAVFVGGPLRSAIPQDLLVWVVLFVLTVFVEWPFCHWLLRNPAAPEKCRAVRSLRASIFCNCVSYAVLLPLYVIVRVWEAGL